MKRLTKLILFMLLVIVFVGIKQVTNATHGDLAERDGMVYIPPGHYRRTNHEISKRIDTRPQIYLSGYYIDIFETTNKEFEAFLNLSQKSNSGSWDLYDSNNAYSRIININGTWMTESSFEDHPVVNVTWFGAESYCRWRGGRLPTEAEWEKAVGSSSESYFPWGTVELSCSFSNYSRTCSNGTDPVGFHESGVSKYGVHDMIGNVSEWVWDYYSPDYHPYPLASNPSGAPTGARRIIRGESWATFPVVDLWPVPWRISWDPHLSNFHTGFRCAASP